VRFPRIRPEGSGYFVHVCNRIGGYKGVHPFTREDKQEFLLRALRLNEYFTIDLLAYAVLGSHYHCIYYVPADPPSHHEAARRFAQYYKDEERIIVPGTKECERIANRLRDISALMHDLQQPFTAWYNRNRKIERRGHLWGARFRDVILQTPSALWFCMRYVEQNPVRARLAGVAEEYRFCTFAPWSANGKHPFESAIVQHVLPMLADLTGATTIDQLYSLMQKSLREKDPEDAQCLAYGLDPNDPSVFSTTANRRVAQWTRGRVIGTLRGIFELLERAWPARRPESITVVPAVDPTGRLINLFSLRCKTA